MKLRKRLFCLIMTALLGGFTSVLAHPDFDVHPRNIENALGRMFVRQDTLVINNVGDQELTWEMTVEAEVENWLSAAPANGRVGAGGWGLVIVRQDGRDLEPDHYYGNIHFTSNDPTRETYDVPVAGHTTEFPRIETGWAIPQQGEWWGVDLDRAIGDMEWGRVYSFNLNIRNRGTALLDCDTIICNNAFFSIAPGDFNLDPGGNRNVAVTFRAVETGGNAGTITSQSNAWDPRELNFRITATVLPAFRRGGSVPDTAIDEDANEILIADLDTIFISSDAGTELVVTPSAGLVTRLARNRELFIRSRPNWFGQASVVLQAVLNDSVLVDTFNVQVRPVSDAPEPFDLISPTDADTLYYDGGDSLFVWQGTTDPDLDTVYFRLVVFREGESEAPIYIADSLTETSSNLRDLYLNPDLFGQFGWTVTALGGGRARPAWSTFFFTLTADRLSATNEIAPPENSDLVSIFPSPFNGKVSIILRPATFGLCRVELFSADGRSSGVFLNENRSPGSHRLDLDLSHLASGYYLMTLQVDGNSIVKSVNYLR